MGRIVAAIVLGAVVVIVIVALLRARRWLFFVWSVLRPAAWPAAFGLLLFAVLGLVDQGQALVQRALEGAQRLPLVLVTLLAAGLMGYAAASLLFVRYAPIVAGLRTARGELRLSSERYDAWCARLRRTFPLVVFAQPLLALLPGALLLALPDHRDLVTLAPLTCLGLVVALGLLGADTRLLRARHPPQRKWLWPLRYPDLSDDGIADALAVAGEPAPRHALHRLGDALLAGMLPGTRLVFALAFAIGVVIFVAATNLRTDWTAALGTAAIVVAAAASMAVTGALLAHWVNHRFSVTIPYLLGLLLLGAGLFARWELSDNHAVREVAGADRAAELARAQARPTLEEHLADWLQAHRSTAAGRGQPYPLLVAAAEGGGIRAALWTALALGELQSRIPSLPCDLFAIVGVSGGALGAATYAAMLADDPPDCTNEPAAAARLQALAQHYTRKASAAFAQDLLAPAAAGLFFPDLLQRFLPLALLPDRQTYLEDAWERAWADAEPAMAGLDRPFLSLFPEPRRASLPALFLVASEVEGGRRWITSNVRIDKNSFADAADTLAGAEIVDTDDLRRLTPKPFPVSAAAGMSARFPYVSPPGTLHFEAGQLDSSGQTLAERTYHVLDGGVVEASGAATAGEILLALRSHCGVDVDAGALACKVLPPDPSQHRPRAGVVPCDGVGDCLHIRPAVLQLTNAAWDASAVPPTRLDAAIPAFPELLGPVDALLASRDGRGRGAHDRLQGDRFLTADQSCFALDIILDSDGNGDASIDPKVPLGWTLRHSHVRAMQARIVEILDRGVLPAGQRAVDFASWRQRVYGGGLHRPCDVALPVAASAD